ncbi:MAG TPA: energy transducer TonB [Rhizomicrobium sp.]|jgi:protein TonB|nr:energy transducer TonB [Rhizomicrobium sp.]
MERPQHELAAVAAHGNKNKTMSLGLVIGIHVVIISALIIGLSSDQIGKTFVEITATMVPKKAAVQDLPPPPISVVKPPPAVVPPIPKIEIAAAPQPVIAQPKIVALPPTPPSPPKEIARTHTLPPYPALSQRMGEQGTTALTCYIDVDGKPRNCSVTRSSGSQRLDDAASSYVMDHYTWEPATRDGKPVADKTQLNVVWDLKNAQ